MGESTEVSVLSHVRHTVLRKGEIGVMSKQMKELDKNHFKIVQLDAWKSED
jgi:hypothetical protein